MNWRPQYLVVAMVLIACSFCYADPITVEVGTGTVTPLTGSEAGGISVTGTLPSSDTVDLYTFTLTSASEVEIQSYSYGGGINAAGQTIASGGFEIGELAVYNASGAELDAFGQGTNPGCPHAAVDGGGYCGDVGGTALLGPGTYTIALMATGVSPVDFTLGDGFGGTGVFTTSAPSNPTTGFPDLTDIYAIDAVPVPEPATLVLLGSGLLLASVKLRKRANSVGCETHNEQ